MRLLIIFVMLILISLCDEVYAKETKWKLKKTIEHDRYYENYGTKTKKTNINGKNKKIKLELREFFPIETKRNEKEGRCRDYRIQEISHEGIVIEKSYSLNDCLPCIDKGAGYMCSYPYFEIIYLYDGYGIYDPTFDVLSETKDVTDDGAKQVIFSINIGSREEVMFIEMYPELESLGLEGYRIFNSQIIKYNTRLRKIRTESSRIRKIQNDIFRLVFDRIKNNALTHIKDKTKLNIREKDIKILFKAEPSLSITKFQTRD